MSACERFFRDDGERKLPVHSSKKDNYREDTDLKISETPEHFRLIPFRCPICIGTGKIQYNPDNPFQKDSASTNIIYSCKPCSGTGIIWG